MNDNLCSKIRSAILKQEPFCISDLYGRLKDLTDNRDMILQCLEELYAERLLDYRPIEKELCAFVVS